MRYYVVSDIHGFYDEFINALNEKGYFEDKEEHKLVICGDLLDRGKQALKLQKIILDLLTKDEVILVKGNHEDLMLDMIRDWDSYSYEKHHHKANGTVDTALQLTQTNLEMLYNDPKDVKDKLVRSPLITTIIPKMVDYYETDHYIFIHGWIPCVVLKFHPFEYVYNKQWRNADESMWIEARWLNGMVAANNGVIENDKTIICGHYHCSYGHAHYENKGSELGKDADFSPYYDKGIIAIDGCTPLSGKVNYIVLED